RRRVEAVAQLTERLIDERALARVAGAEREVGFAARQVDRARLDRDLERDRRMTLGERGDGLREELGQHVAGRDTDRPRDAARLRGQLAHACAELQLELLGGGAQTLAGVGEADAVDPPLDEPRADRALEPTEPARESRGRDAERT